MDINEALRNLRDGVSAFWEATEGGGDVTEAAEIMAVAAEAVDSWLSMGGMLPVAWNRCQP